MKRRIYLGALVTILIGIVALTTATTAPAYDEGDTVDYQMRMLLPEAPEAPLRYCRLQTDLGGASDDLGDATRANIGGSGRSGPWLKR